MRPAKAESSLLLLPIMYPGILLDDGGTRLSFLIRRHGRSWKDGHDRPAAAIQAAAPQMSQMSPDLSAASRLLLFKNNNQVHWHATLDANETNRLDRYITVERIDSGQHRPSLGTEKEKEKKKQPTTGQIHENPAKCSARRTRSNGSEIIVKIRTRRKKNLRAITNDGLPR